MLSSEVEAIDCASDLGGKKKAGTPVSLLISGCHHVARSSPREESSNSAQSTSTAAAASPPKI